MRSARTGSEFAPTREPSAGEAGGFLFVEFSCVGSSASLDRSPRHNWVEDSGELPPYVREIARSIEKSGHTLESAISIAISRIKVWAAGGDGVTAKTQAKAAAALAEWNALKAKNKARMAVKASADTVLDLAALRRVQDPIGRLVALAGPSTAVREKLAGKGHALPDGSYPIPNVAYLKKAIQAFGRSKPGDRAKVKAHIKKRARALGAYDLIPDDWK